uniref:Putative secreted peptide n=1 Tax=Anopheles braziliensis TaxID=58242 RepID=A0A2M3ZW21_9DIPT
MKALTATGSTMLAAAASDGKVPLDTWADASLVVSFSTSLPNSVKVRFLCVTCFISASTARGVIFTENFLRTTSAATATVVAPSMLP